MKTGNKPENQSDYRDISTRRGENVPRADIKAGLPLRDGSITCGRLRMSTAAALVLSESWLELPDGQLCWLKGRCSIGRQDDNDLVLNATSLSRHHALLAASDHGYTLTDLHSSNGTYVNRELLKRPRLLRDRDELQFGELVLRYRCTRHLEVTDGNPSVNVTRRLDDCRPRDCWLLLADVAGYSELNVQLGGEAALRLLQTWIAGVRRCLEQNGACINSYVGDAIFAWWACDVAPPGQVVGALRDLEAYRGQSPVPFRVAMHHGCALFTKSEQGEELTGPDVNFLFRSEKIAKRFHATSMLSAPAVQTLKLEGTCALLGTATVDGMSGDFAFYGFIAATGPAPDAAKNFGLQ